MIDFEDDIRTPTDSELKTIAALAKEQVGIASLIVVAQATLKELTEKHNKISESDLPQAMEAAGMEAFTLKSGEKIKVNEKLYASLPKNPSKHAEALRWMTGNGLESLIKNDVTVLFDKGDHERTAKLMGWLNEHAYASSKKQSVNTGSMKSAIKEKLANGDAVPLETLGAYFRKFAEVSL